MNSLYNLFNLAEQSFNCVGPLSAHCATCIHIDDEQIFLMKLPDEPFYPGIERFNRFAESFLQLFADLLDRRTAVAMLPDKAADVVEFEAEIRSFQVAHEPSPKIAA